MDSRMHWSSLACINFHTCSVECVHACQCEMLQLRIILQRLSQQGYNLTLKEIPWAQSLCCWVGQSTHISAGVHKKDPLTSKILCRDLFMTNWTQNEDTIIYKCADRVHWAPALGGTHSWIFLRVVEYGTYCCAEPLTLIWWTSARNFLGSGGCVVGGSSVIQCSQRCLSNK